jgi:hypothetical protein
MTTKRTARKKPTRKPVSKTNHALQMKNETLMMENDRLRDVQAALNKKLFEQRAVITKEVLDAEMSKRVRRAVVISLKELSDKLKADGESAARAHRCETGDCDDFPSGIVVTLQTADIIKQMAEHQYGHKFDFTVHK